MIEQYKHPVCRGSWALGTACGMCERCKATMPYETLYKLESQTTEDQKILLADKDARIEELEGALRPFAEVGSFWNKGNRKHVQDEIDAHAVVFRVGDYRRACAALASVKKDQQP